MEEKGITMGKEGSLHVYEEGELLHIVVDTSKELGPSASGKTTLIASSGGNAYIHSFICICSSSSTTNIYPAW